MKLRLFPTLVSLAMLPFLASFMESLGSPSYGARTETRQLRPEGQELVDALPEDTILFLEGPALAPLLQAGSNSDLLRALGANSSVRALLDQADPSLEELIEKGSTILDTPLLPRLGSVLAGGLAIGMSPGETKLNWTLVAHSDDADQLEESLGRVLRFVGEQAGFPRAFNQPHDTVAGADVWYIGEEFGVAQSGTFLVASTSQDHLRHALASVAPVADQVAQANGESIEAALRLTIRADEWLKVDEGSEGIKGARQLEELRASAAKPAVQFLLGPSLAMITRSDEFRIELFVDGEDLRLELQGEGIDAGPFAALLPKHAKSFAEPPPALQMFGQGANLLVYRDIDALFEHRADLFPANDLPEFAKSISNLSPFLGGMDLTEEVFPGLSPWMRLVVDPVEFDPSAHPAQPLPAACLLVQVEDPERLGNSLVAAFQSAVSLINLERAQQMKPPLLLGIELVDGIEMSKAHYLLSDPKGGVDMEYNLAPACALVDSTFVLGTHKHLVERVVRDLASQTSRSVEVMPTAENLRLSGALVVDALVENLHALVMSKVLDEGVSKSEAKGELEVVIGLIELMKTLELQVECTDPQSVRVELRLDVRDDSKDGEMVAR